MKRSAARAALATIGNAGYRLNEYLVILSPHEELRKRIMAVKEEFSKKFDAPVALRGGAFLTLVRFKQLELSEERIINHLKVVAMSYHPIKVELKGFGSYPSHTIFINVTTKEPVRELVKQIKPWQRLLRLNDENKPHFIQDPVITVARQLKPWQYETAWQEYQHKNFTGRFIAEGMLLLKRKAGEKRYQIAGRFDFVNAPVSTKQGELFS